VTDCNLAVDDASTHRAEHLAKLRLRPDPPKPPVLAPMTATGLLPMVFVAIGRDTQSSAFLSTPGIDELYSGVTKRRRLLRRLLRASVRLFRGR